MRPIMRRRRPIVEANTVLVFSVVAAFATAVAAFLRHAWWTIGLMMSNEPLAAGKAILAVLGILIPPLGAFHGVWLWFH